jgi:hypothetical protein
MTTRKSWAAKWATLLALNVPAFLMGCGSGNDYESYSSIKDGVATQLLPSNHPHGYGKTDCFQCHTARNIHVGATPQTALARSLVEQSGIQSCRGCHGSNGVTP